MYEKFEYKENKEEHQKLVKLSKKVDLSTEDSLPKMKNDYRKWLISDRKKITSANKSSLHQARHMKTDEHSTCMRSQSTVSESHQVVANNNIDVDA